jgi:hypothetical protein
MAYAVEFSPSAEREFRKLAREIQFRLRARIDARSPPTRVRLAQRSSRGATTYGAFGPATIESFTRSGTGSWSYW